MKEYLLAFIDLLFERKCLVCGKTLTIYERHLCCDCLEDIPLTYFWTWKDNPAEKKLWGRSYIERIISLFLFSHENNYPNIIYSLKYKGNRKIGRHFGAILGSYIADQMQDIDYIVPVPLHWKKHRKRGYNQSYEIAKGINSVLKKEIATDIIRRRRNTTTQTKMSKDQKWDNLAGAFELKNSKRTKSLKSTLSIENSHIHILLVDDVLTTGATIIACCEELKKLKNLKVSVVTLAYVE